MFTSIKRYLPILGIILFIYLLFRLDLSRVLYDIKKIDFKYILIIPLITTLVLSLQTFKWSLILKNQNYTHNFIELFRINIIGFFYSSITPGKIGSFIKIIYLEKNIVDASSSVVLDKLLDLLVIIIFSFIGAYIILGKITVHLYGVFIITLIIILILIILNKRELTIMLYKYLIQFRIINRLMGKYRESIAVFFDSFPKKNWLLLPFILTKLLSCCIRISSISTICFLYLLVSFQNYSHFF